MVFVKTLNKKTHNNYKFYVSFFQNMKPSKHFLSKITQTQDNQTELCLILNKDKSLCSDTNCKSLNRRIDFHYKNPCL
ncbi:hypothetical protein HanIR_Chr06g0296601 [Helianthus annuus]|nr:hypothetical protein HanIR_Chr06g0296601 [Helianthus annuus]